MAELTGTAPGRVNLIGEHTDYNGGFVMPVALGLTTTVTVERRAGPITVAGPGCDERTLVYAQAVAEVLGEWGFAAVIESDVPVGAGLGSSAALEVALARALRPDTPARELALACHRAESEFVGVECGVMDQIAAAEGEPRTAVFLDCTLLDARPLPMPAEWELLVVDSRIRHSNAESGYRERVAECREACARLGVGSLRELRSLPADAGPRVRHVLEENVRVVSAAAAVAAADFDTLARLMRESHASQRELYEVSLPEIDQLAERLEAEGAAAARLTGGGFGGSLVALCRSREGEAIAAAAGVSPGSRWVT